MKAWVWRRYGSFDGLQLETRTRPEPGPHEVLVRIHASALNQRDIMAARGTLPRAGDPKPVIPLSDGAGEVVAIGEGVRSLAVGDRVMSLFIPSWQGGPLRPEYGRATLGSDVDGVLTQYSVMPETGMVKFPAHLSYAEDATLPCAAVTAWSALFVKSALQPGETVLVLGSGGVALFTLQFAKAAGARVILTTSSDARGERLKQLGADAVVNYRSHADWPAAVRAESGGAGVDVVVETGGGGTYAQSLQATARNARVALVGLMTGMADAGGSMRSIMMNNLTIRAVQVGSRADTEAMLRFIDAVRLNPIIDSHHTFEQAPAAYARLDSGEAFGKVVIDHDQG